MSQENSINWRDRLELRFDGFVEEFVVDGVDHNEVLDAVIAHVAARRKAADGASEPARAPEEGPAIDEPANDWPAA